MRATIVHANTGNSYYPQGAKRLEKSLVYHGWAHDILIWNDWPGDRFDRQCPWNIKAEAIMEAAEREYDVIIWLDASIWALKNPNRFVDIVVDRGLFTWRDGHTVAQTASDRALAFWGAPRKEAVNINEVRSSVFGFDLRQPLGHEFYFRFIAAARLGIFEGEKSVTPKDFGNPWQSFASRQDQTVVSMLRHYLHGKYKEPHNSCAIESDPGEYVIGTDPATWEKETGKPVPDTVFWAMQGI